MATAELFVTEPFPTVLLVSADNGLLQTLAACLAELETPPAVWCSRNGEEALAHVHKQGQAAVVVIDCRLPAPLDGALLHREIRAGSAATVTLLLTVEGTDRLAGVLQQYPRLDGVIGAPWESVDVAELVGFGLRLYAVRQARQLQLPNNK